MTFWVALIALSGAYLVHYQALQNTVLDSQKAKTWLAQSDVYRQIRDDTLANQIKNAIELQSPGNKLVDIGMIQRALRAAIPDKELRQTFEPAVGSIYRWMDSKEPEVTFEIPLGTKKEAFFASLSSQLESKIGSLKTCDTYQDTTEALLSNDCRPLYGSAPQATEQLMQYIRTTDAGQFDTITAETFALPKSQQGTFGDTPSLLNFLWVTQILAWSMIVLATLVLVASRRLTGLVAVGAGLLAGALLVILTQPLLAATGFINTTGSLSFISTVVKTFVPKFMAEDTRYALFLAAGGSLVLATALVVKKLRRNHG